jgi:hypothetical protein
MRSQAASTFFIKRPRVKGGRGVRYARTIFNAHHVSQAFDAQLGRISVFYNEP